MTSPADSLSLSEFSIFVSGATGFLGEALVSTLTQYGAAVSPLPRDFSGAQIPAESGKKRVLVHLAGMSHAGQCEENPAEAFEANVALVLRALFFCQKQGINLFIFPSTGSVYSDQMDRPLTESDPASPHDIYGATKLAAETLILRYSKRLGIRSLIVRIGNVYGPGCHSDSVIGTLCQQIANGHEITLRDLTPVRDFIYKRDVVHGLIRLLQTAETHSEFLVNLSTGKGTSIGHLTDTACRLALVPVEKIRPSEGPKGPPSRIVLDNTLLKKLTGWSPQYNLEDGLKETLKQ